MQSTKRLGATVAQVVAIDRGDHHVAQAHVAGWSRRGGAARRRPAAWAGRGHVAEAAAAAHTPPRIMKVAAPCRSTPWMFGQEASSHTVTRRFSRSLALSLATALPGGMRTRIQLGFAQRGRRVELGTVARDLVLADLARPGAGRCRRRPAAPTTRRGMVLGRWLAWTLAQPAAAAVSGAMGGKGGAGRAPAELARQPGATSSDSTSASADGPPVQHRVTAKPL